MKREACSSLQPGLVAACIAVSLEANSRTLFEYPSVRPVFPSGRVL